MDHINSVLESYAQHVQKSAVVALQDGKIEGSYKFTGYNGVIIEKTAQYLIFGCHDNYLRPEMCSFGVAKMANHLRAYGF